MYNSKQSDDLVEDLLNGKIYSGLTSKLFRGELFTKYNIGFETGIDYGEDFLCC